MLPGVADPKPPLGASLGEAPGSRMFWVIVYEASQMPFLVVPIGDFVLCCKQRGKAGRPLYPRPLVSKYAPGARVNEGFPHEGGVGPAAGLP